MGNVILHLKNHISTIFPDTFQYPPCLKSTFQHILNGGAEFSATHSMKILPEFGRSAFIVPSSATKYLDKSDATELASLLYVLSKENFTYKDGAKAVGVSDKAFKDAIETWISRGVISRDGDVENKLATADDPTLHERKAKITKRTSSLPAYTTEETAKFLEHNAGTAEIIDSCENIIGKIFTTAETNIVIGMLDHLSLSGEYVLLLFAHAAKIDKKSVRYVEKLALSFVDRDITRYTELEAELANIETTEDTLKFIRKIFGIGKRVFTEKERALVRRWCVDFAFGNDIIEKAYEITANSTGGASLSYANAILENWYKAELHTIEDIDKYTEEFNSKKAVPQKDKNKNPSAFAPSFDNDEFFESALKRSFDEDIR